MKSNYLVGRERLTNVGRERLTNNPMETKQKKTYEEHRERHLKLHRMLDELCADWIWETGGMPSKATVLDLMNWSHDQTLDPSDKDGRFLPPNIAIRHGEDGHTHSREHRWHALYFA